MALAEETFEIFLRHVSVAGADVDHNFAESADRRSFVGFWQLSGQRFANDAFHGAAVERDHG
jgi:hypothetical protein